MTVLKKVLAVLMTLFGLTLGVFLVLAVFWAIFPESGDQPLNISIGTWTGVVLYGITVLLIFKIALGLWRGEAMHLSQKTVEAS